MGAMIRSGDSRLQKKGARGHMAGEKTFEQNLKALEKIVGKLESGSVSLDESMRLFQKGKTLNKACEERLKEAELKIRALVEDEEGELETKEFEPAEEKERDMAEE